MSELDLTARREWRTMLTPDFSEPELIYDNLFHDCLVASRFFRTYYIAFNAASKPRLVKYFFKFSGGAMSSYFAYVFLLQFNLF